MRGLMMDVPLTTGALLARAERLYPAAAVVSRRPDRSLDRSDYGHVAPRARRLAVALAEAGVRPGEAVATLMWNQREHLEAYYGVPWHGAVVHTLNPRLPAEDLAHVAEDAGDVAVIVDASLLEVLAPVAALRPFGRVIVVGDADGPPDGAVPYEHLLDRPDPGELPEPADEHRAAAMCFTSGTTGRPKGVVYSHRALVLHAMALAMADGFGIAERDVVLPVVPMFHVQAWGLPYACPMTGAGLVLPGRHLDATSLLELFDAERVTFTAGVPTVWLAVLQELEAHPGRYDLSAMRAMLVGGSAAPRTMIERYDRLGVPVLHAWGMTETTPVGTVGHLSPALDGAPAEERLAGRARQGRPLPFVELRARGDAGLVAWDGAAMGELEVRGPWVASAYLGGAGEDRFTEDGWFRTGDVVTIAPDGAMEITDREKDLIKSGGEWISSVAMENALVAHPAVAEAAVVAVPHPRWLERPLACVVRAPGAGVTADALVAHLAERFPRWWLPDAVEFVEEIPHTATGKIKKSVLRERFAERLAGA
jgi:fatty-acyl-CoA synthase